MAALPATFKMGFSASTGGSTNYHEIRNLQVQALTEATDDKERTGMGVPVSGNVSGNDRAPAGSTFSITAPPPAAEGTVTLDPATGAYTFTPAPGFAGDAHFTYQLCSGPNHTRPCVTANVTVAVNPVAVNDDYRTTQGVPVNDTVAGNDTAPTNAVFSLTTPPAAAEGSVTMNADGSFIFTPATGFTGTANFGYRVCNAAGTHCATTVVAVAVGTATPPVVLPDSFNGQPGQRITGHVGTNDPTVPLGAVFSLVPGTAPDPATQGVLQFNPDGRFTFTPVAGFTGTISFSYQLCSGAGGTAPCVTTTVTLNIRPAAAGVQAVPTLHTWALMGLAALLGGLGARRQRKA